MKSNRRHSYLCRIGRLSGVRYRGRHRESLCASGLRSPELSAQVRRANSCTSCKPAHMDAFITRTGRNYASRTAAERVCGLDVNQNLSQPTKCIPLTAHKAAELTKLQAALNDSAMKDVKSVAKTFREPVADQVSLHPPRSKRSPRTWRRGGSSVSPRGRQLAPPAAPHRRDPPSRSGTCSLNASCGCDVRGGRHSGTGRRLLSSRVLGKEE